MHEHIKGEQKVDLGGADSGKVVAVVDDLDDVRCVVAPAQFGQHLRIEIHNVEFLHGGQVLGPASTARADFHGGEFWLDQRQQIVALYEIQRLNRLGIAPLHPVDIT